MIERLPPKALAGLLGLLFLHCSLTIDEEALGGEWVSECADDQKQCEVGGVLKCVGRDDPLFGCAKSACTPCNLPNTTPICGKTGDCAKSTCHPSWDDCNGKSSDGCEAPLNYSVDNCGECGEKCTPRDNADVSCGGGHCYIRECLLDFEDCNEKYDDGCEIDTLTDSDNCGACGEPCDGVCCQGVCCQDACCDGVCQQSACDD